MQLWKFWVSIATMQVVLSVTIMLVELPVAIMHMTVSVKITNYGYQSICKLKVKLKKKQPNKPGFLNCCLCFVELWFWVEPLPCTGRSPFVLSNALSRNRITELLLSKWRLLLMFTEEINWFHTKKVGKVTLQTIFLCIQAFVYI